MDEELSDSYFSHPLPAQGNDIPLLCLDVGAFPEETQLEGF